MVPLVVSRTELDLVRKRIDATATLMWKRKPVYCSPIVSAP